MVKRYMEYVDGETQGVVLYDDYAALAERCERLEAALREARRAIGDHYAPNDCYATGPLTGDEYMDLVQCPACAFIATHERISGSSGGEGWLSA
jgi:hypothetical protein